jgi:hypothetical protein
MTDIERRLLRIEAAMFRQDCEVMGREKGISADRLIREALRWLSLPDAQALAEYPQFSAADLAELRKSLPAIKYAMRD